MINFDFWYKNTLADVDGVHISFYPNEGIYRGNVYNGINVIGDFTATDSAEIETVFPGIFGN